jgi:phospholipid N-methyltransferase
MSRIKRPLLSPNRAGRRKRDERFRNTPLLDMGRFFLAWASNPRDIAAVAPSGKALARAITRSLSGETGKVLELGPGTGAFTKAMLEQGVAETDLTLIERDDGFARLLRKRFPHATILNVDAAEISQRDLPEPGLFGAAVCGLGLLNMTPAKVESILRATFALLQPDASLYIFTYGHRCPVPRRILDLLGLESFHVATAWRNLPPGSVYRLARRTGNAG